MTIHEGHPFMLPPEQRDPIRRLRGRMPAPVTIWTSQDDRGRDGWTISSVLVADGDPAEVIALVDEDCDWWEVFQRTGHACVNVLGPGQGGIADVFARAAPSPGGVFRTGGWTEGQGGPRLTGAAGWAEVELLDANPGHSGWGLLVRARLGSIDLVDGVDALEHRNGRYL